MVGESQSIQDLGGPGRLFISIDEFQLFLNFHQLLGHIYLGFIILIIHHLHCFGQFLLLIQESRPLHICLQDVLESSEITLDDFLGNQQHLHSLEPFVIISSQCPQQLSLPDSILANQTELPSVREIDISPVQ